MIESASVTGRKGATRAHQADVAAGLRMRQWSKNLLLFAGLLFAAKLGDPGRWADAWLAFAAFCAASSAAYLLNDVRDADADRHHPVKRRRPVASGAVSPRAAAGVAALLAAGALAIGGIVEPAVSLLVAAFLALQVLYSFGLKLLVGLDVLAIAALFTIRAAAGAEAVSVRVSPWLLACTALLALFLALGKRRAELGARGDSHRAVLTHYSLPALNRLLVLVAGATIAAYCAYALSARHSLEMAVTVPFVAVGLLRYLVLIHRDGLGEAPEDILLSDPLILLALGSWVATAALVLTLT